MNSTFHPRLAAAGVVRASSDKISGMIKNMSLLWPIAQHGSCLALWHTLLLELAIAEVESKKQMLVDHLIYIILG